MSYELFVANRYLRSKRRIGFISLITYLSIIGVTIGVAALIIVLSVMNGAESEVRSRIIGFGAHIELRKYHGQSIENPKTVRRQIDSIEHIVGISPYISEKALIITKKKKQAIAIKGVDPATVDRVSDIRNNINAGVFDLGNIKAANSKSYPGIVIGTYLADELGVEIGEKIQVLSPSGITPLLSTMPHMRTFEVAGFFETGIYEFDNVFAYISLKEAQRLFEMRKNISGFEIKLENLDDAEIVAEQLRQTLQYPFTAITWFTMNRNLFSWLQFQKWGMFITLSLIIMVAAFNIVSTLIMIVLEKTKEIGILKSMGATTKGIMRIFIFEGLIGGVVGTLLGCGIGFFVCWLQFKYKLISLPPDVYIISALPVLMQSLDFIGIAVVAVLLCFLATVYPAWKAANLQPVEAMRYE